MWFDHFENIFILIVFIFHKSEYNLLWIGTKFDSPQVIFSLSIFVIIGPELSGLNSMNYDL